MSLFRPKRNAVNATSRYRGVTSIEFLVILAILALLIAILLPSLSRARAQAKTAVCMANLTGLGKASLIYAAHDPGELLIPVADTSLLYPMTGAIEWGGKAGRGQPTVANDAAGSLFGTGSFRGPAHRPLNHVLYKGGFRDWNPPNGSPAPGPDRKNWIVDTQLDIRIYRCPSDEGYAGGGFLYTAGEIPDRNEKAFRDGGLSAYDHYGNSYAANVLWIAGGTAGETVRSQSPYLAPLSRVPCPAGTVAYLEAPARFAWVWGAWADSGCDYDGRAEDPTATIPGWHGKAFTFNVGFSDGHAASTTIRGCQRPAPEFARGSYPRDECGFDVEFQTCYQCVRVRAPDSGRGWQLDTYPGLAVKTEYTAPAFAAEKTLSIVP